MALRLAIIEDNADLLDELLAWLGYRGFEVWGTRSAEAFWRQLHSHPVDIVLVDIGLPGEDGFSVLNYLHELGHYGLVVVSARGQQQDKLQALSLGADAYLIKPVNFAHLAETLTALGFSRSIIRWWPLCTASRSGSSATPRCPSRIL